MTHVISTINLKGGVGKTTTTIGLAEVLSAEFGKKVLVIDLDPQTNATTVLIGEVRWGELNNAGRTLATLFTDALRSDEEPARFDLEATLQRKVSAVAEVDSVDLLRRAVRPVIDGYDYVLIDCPPNLGIVTYNGLRLSEGYIIPTIPDVLSTYGIPQIQSRVKAFADNLGESIRELGIVVTKYRSASTVHRTTIKSLEDDEELPIVFETRIPEGNAIAGSAEHAPYSTLRQKYQYQGGYEVFRELAKEFVAVVEAGAE